MQGTDGRWKALPGFVGGVLDRADPVRNSAELTAERFHSLRSRRVVMQGLEPVEQDGMLALEMLPPDARLDEHVLLGIDAQDRAIFALLATGLPHGGAPSPRSWALATQVPPDQMALYGTARSLVDWHARHPFCAACGAATMPQKAGWARQCPACRTEHFPRVDPVVIMLATHQGRVLLGRQPRFPAGRYSALAGFVEPGETFEEAVARELHEEAGIRVGDVRYVMSQPWPFPSSLMIACTAEAEDDALVLDMTELEDAMWCDAPGVRAAMDGDAAAPFVAPPPMAVAWHLLAHWLEQQDACRA